MRMLGPLLLLGCTSAPPLPVAPHVPVDTSASTQPPSADSGEIHDTAPPDGPHVDPIVRGDTLDLEVRGPELTDGVRVDDLLLYAGQEQTGDGGVWAFDVSDPAAPVLTGKTSSPHLQRICWAGTHAWAMTRSAELHRVAVEDGVPMLFERFSLGSWGGGLDCVDDRIAVALGQSGVRAVQFAASGPTGLTDLATIDTPATDVLWEGDRLWVLSEDALSAWHLADEGATLEGSVSLDGTCRDLAPGSDWIAVACGAGGVALVARGDGQPERLAQWQAGFSARAVEVQEDHVLVAAWTDLLLLDASDPTQPILRATEPAGSAVMAVVADAEQQAWVADWNRPFGITWAREDSPEVRPSRSNARPGDTVTVVNDGLAPLTLATLDGTLDQTRVPPGEYALWTLPTSGTTATVQTNDPDEPEVTVVLATGEGMQPGAEAPAFIEQDVDGVVWDSSTLRGSVVFVGLFQEGCPTCESDVPDTDDLLVERYGDESGLVALWSFGGPADGGRRWRSEAGIELPILADEDDSMRADYFIPNGEDAFAANPRHYVIGRDGRFVAVLTAPSPGALVEALDIALAE